MKLTNEQLKSLYHGALWFDEEDGYLRSYQHTKEQIAYFKEVSDFWYERCTASSSKTLEFVTEATKCSFKYKLLWIGSTDSVELWADGQAIQIYYINEILLKISLHFDFIYILPYL